MSRSVKSLDCSHSQPTIDVTDLIDSHVLRGGLDLNQVKNEIPLGLDKNDVTWSYWHADGRAVELKVYWVQESGLMRRYLMFESALTQLSAHNAATMMDFALTKSRAFPSIFKMALADEILIVTVRAPVDGLSETYLVEVIEAFDGFGATLLAEIRSRFGTPSYLEALRAEDDRSRLQ